MQKLSVWAVRLSLVYFALGASVGALLLAGKAVALPPWLWLLRAAHVEVLLFGFMVQLVMGVGYWILPRVPAPRGEPLMTAALAFLNAGVWTVALATALLPGTAWFLGGRLCEAAAVVLFAAHVWPRVRPARLAA